MSSGNTFLDKTQSKAAHNHGRDPLPEPPRMGPITPITPARSGKLKRPLTSANARLQTAGDPFCFAALLLCSALPLLPFWALLFSAAWRGTVQSSPPFMETISNRFAADSSFNSSLFSFSQTKLLWSFSFHTKQGLPPYFLSSLTTTLCAPQVCPDLPLNLSRLIYPL
ncbi:hypothetical protein BDV12DRAFT_16962 [Aspergillus spectabilis]